MAAVEFAIVASLLLLLVFGIIQFGLALSKIETFENAAREGAREAAVAQSTGATVTSIKNAVVNAASPYTISNGTLSGAAAISVTQNGVPVTGTPCSGVTRTSPATSIAVSWSQRIGIDVPFWKNATVDHTIQATFRCEPAST